MHTINGQMIHNINEWMGGWMNGWMDLWMIHPYIHTYSGWIHMMDGYNGWVDDYILWIDGYTRWMDIYIYIYIYTLTGHFIRYTLLVPGWTPFCLQNCLNSSWHRFNKVLETLLWDFGPYWHDRITQLLQICRLHIHDVNLSFHHIPKVLYWIEIWWLWRPFE